MTTTALEAVKAAKNPRDAILKLAALIDGLKDRVDALEQGGGWEDWGGGVDLTSDIQEQLDAAKPAAYEAAHQEALRRMANDKPHEITLQPVSPERQQARRDFATNVLKLSEALPNDGADWIQAYAKGGPMWLYATNRDLVMSYPFNVRQQLVQDVAQDDVTTAHEMSIDILKKPTTPPDLSGNDSTTLAKATVG